MNIFEKFQKVGLGAPHELLNPKKLKISTKFDPPGHFLNTFLKPAPFIFGLSKSLAFLDLEAHGMPLAPPF